MTAASTESRRFQLGVRHDLPMNTNWCEHFDTVHRERGVDVEQLDETSLLEYLAERAAYEHVHLALKRSPVKRKRIAEQHAIAQKWAERETKAGRSLWASRVPEWFMPVSGVAVRSAAAVAQGRPREQRPPRRRRDSHGSSRDGPSRSDDEAEPPGVALKGGR